MSFTAEVKNEISKLENLEVENLSELSAIIRNVGVFDNCLKITTENSSVARRIFLLIKKIYNEVCQITVRRGYNFNKNYIYILHLNQQIENIKRDLSIDTKNGIPQSDICADEDLTRAYLRGIFLSCGSINDPKKSRYHLEFSFDNLEYSKFVSKLLNQFRLNSKILKRDNKYMVYIKEAEKIGDFLRIIKAISAVFYYEDIRIYRDHKNMTNRLNNCEQANVDKIIETALKQVEEIEKIQKSGGLDLLDEKVKEAAIYRLKYPEVSMKELSEIISLETGNEITKSGLYHRFKKIENMANRINE